MNCADATDHRVLILFPPISPLQYSSCLCDTGGRGMISAVWPVVWQIWQLCSLVIDTTQTVKKTRTKQSLSTPEFDANVAWVDMFSIFSVSCSSKLPTSIPGWFNANTNSVRETCCWPSMFLLSDTRFGFETRKTRKLSYRSGAAMLCIGIDKTKRLK